MSRLIFLIVLIMTLINFNHAEATDYYVNASVGSNTTGDGSSGSPWKTITYALGQISGSGHTLFVSSGTYNTALGEFFPILMKDGVSLVGSGMSLSFLDASNSNSVVRCVGITDASTRLEGFTIRGGQTSSGGAGIYISAGSVLTIVNNEITENTCGYSSANGGGLYIINSSPAIIGNTISNNSAGSSQNGGGIYISNGSPLIQGNVIANNDAGSFGYGTGIYMYTAAPVIKDNLIIGNGGASYDKTYGHALYINSSSQSRIHNNVIVQNVGTGIYCYMGGKVFNNTISDNGYHGLHLSSGPPDSIFNNILACNGGFGIFEEGTGCDPIKAWYNLFYANGMGVYRDEGAADYYTVTALNTAVAECKNNISGDPMFENKMIGDYHLRYGSPAVDTGDPLFAYNNEPAPNGSRINVGAYGNTSEAMISGGGGGINLSDYYVNASSGSNTSGDGSSGNPWQTITHALSQITGTGQTTVHVSSGTYSASIGEIFPILMKDDVSMIGAGTGLSIIDAEGTNTVIRCVGIVGSTTRLEGFTVQGGETSSGGGGLYISAGSVLTITNNEITENTCGYNSVDGGGIYIFNSSPSIKENTISNNSTGSAENGGGIYISGGSSLIQGNVISGNNSGYFGYGSGIYMYDASPEIKENTIIGNGSLAYENYGHAIYISSFCLPIIANNIIVSNAGDGINCYSGAKIINNTISDNSGDGIFIYAADSIFNNILSYNSGYGIYEYDDASDPVKAWYNLFYANGMGVYRDEGTIDYYTVTALNTTVVECKNNISGDPLFENKMIGNYHLRHGSPAIDAGDPNSPLDPEGTRADIGALPYFQTEFPPAAPKDLSVLSGDGQAELHWTCNTDPDFLRYRIYAGIMINPTVQVDSIDGVSNGTKTITGLSNGIRYYFRISAVDSALLQSGYSNEVNTIPNSPRSLDSLALVTFYDSTGGDNWTYKTNWKSSNPIDTWYGVTVNYGRITAINLNENNLIGVIPSSITIFTQLRDLELRYNQLSGPIPSSITEFDSLRILKLENNMLSGSIPAAIGNLKQLTNLELWGNNLEGSIPSGIGDLTNLINMELYGNGLSGGIPMQIGNLTQLVRLSLASNPLGGSIPSTIGNLSSLSDLFLQGAQLTGNIPTEIGNLTQLHNLYLDNNLLSGSIPSELGNLTQLRHLLLDNNQLTGTIPSVIGNLDSLTVLSLAFNQLTGEVPAEISWMLNIQDIYLDHNLLVNLPDLSSLTKVREFYINNNLFDFGDIEPNINVASDVFSYAPQDSVGRHMDTTVVPGGSINFFALVGGANDSFQWLFNSAEIVGATGSTFTVSNATASEHNGTYTYRITNSLATALTLYARSIYLSVQLPPRYIDSLALVDLYDSTGGENWTNNTNWKSSNPIDTWYGVTVVNNRVEQLWLVENSLSGHIPASIGNLTALTHLILRPNNQSGNIGGLIPSTIGNLTDLVVLQLSHNQLTGSIPVTIGGLGQIEMLTVDNNLLSGSVPFELGNLRKLKHLNFSGNQLSGSIPDVFTTMDSLKELLMSGNHLSGSIPNSIGNLTELVELELSYNQFTGAIPMTMSNLTKLKQLYLRNNQLSGQIPSFLGNFVQLYHLYLTSNQFSGTIPDEVGNMSSLTELNIETNLISGQIPATLGNLSQLQALELGHNQMSGSIPEVIGNLLQLKWIVLDHNQLSGSVPLSIVNLGNLLWLKLNDNQLTGLPDLTSLDSLQNMYIENNKFTFEDIEPNIGAPSQIFTYSPQDSVGTYSTLTMLQGTADTLSVDVGGESNHYQWMKNGVDIPDATSNEYYKLYWGVADSGNYVCRITNTVATELTLYSRHTRIIIYPLPTVPGNLVAVPVTSSRIDLSWTASADATKYYIFQSMTSGSGFNVIDSVNVPATSYSNTGLSPHTTYYYRIYAANQYGGTSSNSNEVSATTPGLAPSLGTPNVSNPSPIPGAAVTITVTVTGTTPTVKLFYGKTTQSEGDSLTMTFNGTNYSATIPGNSVTQEGVWFRIRAQNTGGIAYYPGTTIKANISVTINDMTSIWDNSYFYGGIPAEQYFSISMSMDGSLSLTDLWGTQTLEESIPTNWRAWDFNRTSQSFVDVTTLSGDKAYFLFHREGSAQEIFNSATSKKTNDPLMFDNFLLSPGWNAVPWPFTFPANIYIKDANQDSIGSLWKLWGNSGWEQVTECSAFCGYMIYNKTAGDVRLGNVVSWTMIATKPMIDQSGWRLQLIAESGSYRDAFNFAGVSRDFATMSEPEPLTIGKSIALNFKNNEQNFSSDIRSDAEAGHIWDVTVINTTGNERAVLKWGSQNLPAGLNVMLIDESNNKILRLDGTARKYEFKTHRQNVFKLIAGNAEFVERETLRIKSTLPDEFSLSQNYPNPFNPSTTIKFDVARSGPVKLKVYNILGQEVATLVNGYFETGRDYSVVWNGKDALGRAVASGVYIYRLETEKIFRTKKMLLVK